MTVPHIPVAVANNCSIKDLKIMIRSFQCCANKTYCGTITNYPLYKIGALGYILCVPFCPQPAIFSASSQTEPQAPSQPEPQSVSSSHLLSQVPSNLWSTHPNDVGLIRSASSVKINVNPAKPLPRKRQYPLKPDAEAGIAPVIESLLEQGVIIPTCSPCNTPILPIQKANKTSWRFVQDLRAINDCVNPIFPVLPNPTTILSSIPPTTIHYTVVDLCSAFFSIPVHPESQYLFAFTYKGQQYTWTRLPQGYTESPTLYSRALKKGLIRSDIS